MKQIVQNWLEAVQAKQERFGKELEKVNDEYIFSQLNLLHSRVQSEPTQENIDALAEFLLEWADLYETGAENLIDGVENIEEQIMNGDTAADEEPTHTIDTVRTDLTEYSKKDLFALCKEFELEAANKSNKETLVNKLIDSISLEDLTDMIYE